jgi:hypothetical protein
MSATFPPYHMGQCMDHVKEMILGDPKDTENMYHWAMVRLNLPGSELHDPRKALVAKLRPDGRVAADLFIYMDDFRPTGLDEDACWQANRKAVSTCNHLGIQEAPRKRRLVSRTPGPLAGSMAYTDDPEEGVRVLIFEKKWDKAKRLLQSQAGGVTVGGTQGNGEQPGISDLCFQNVSAYDPVFKGSAPDN